MSVRPIITSTNSFNSIQLAAECVCSLAANGRVMHGRFKLVGTRLRRMGHKK